MSGDWIKLECTTPTKPEVFAIADALGKDPDEIVGKLIRLWIWADQQIENCNAASVTQSAIDRITGAPGFADALLSTGWLVKKEGGFCFPNFDKHNGRTAKTRANTYQRVKRSRNAASASKALPEIEIEIENTTPTTSTKKPTKLKAGYTEEFERFWNVYPPQGKSKKPAAFKAWCEALQQVGRPDASAFLIQRASDYANSPNATNPDAEGKTYVKHATTWLDNACWDDAPEAWGISPFKTSRPELLSFDDPNHSSNRPGVQA